MIESPWLKSILENMHVEIREIRADLKALRNEDIAEIKEWKWKVAGGAAVLSAIVTIAVNLLTIWSRI